MPDEDEKKPSYKPSWMPLDPVEREGSLIPSWIWHLLAVIVVISGGTVVYYFLGLSEQGKSAVMLRSKKRQPKISAAATSSGQTGDSEANKEKSVKESVTGFFGKLLNKEKPGEKPTVRKQVRSTARVVETRPAPVDAHETVPQENLEPVKEPEPSFPPPARQPSAENTLEKIRKDPERIFVDKKISAGDLTYTVLNVSKYGIEVSVENNGDSVKTYYLPKIITEGKASQFDGTVVAPGKVSFGWIVVPDLKAKKKLIFECSAVGSDKRKETVKLDW